MSVCWLRAERKVATVDMELEQIRFSPIFTAGLPLKIGIDAGISNTEVSTLVNEHDQEKKPLIQIQIQRSRLEMRETCISCHELYYLIHPAMKLSFEDSLSHRTEPPLSHPRLQYIPP